MSSKLVNSFHQEKKHYKCYFCKSKQHVKYIVKIPKMNAVVYENIPFGRNVYCCDECKRFILKSK